MIVVSDTGPLRYLVEVAAIDCLPRLYGEVLTTPKVMEELGLSHFPEDVRQWAKQPPDWLIVRSPARLQFSNILDDGEASALSLACECQATLVLVDERDGTGMARHLGLEVFGTLGVLAQAAAHELIDFENAIERLTTRTKFRHTPEVVERTRQRLRDLRNDLEGRVRRT